MSAFNGEKFYGYSPVREPSFTTVPRNFEFKFVRPEQLNKAIKQAQAEKTFGPRPKTEPTKLKNYISKPDLDTHEYELRDRDVETLMSRRRMHKVRVLSDQEVDEIVQKAKLNTTHATKPIEKLKPKFSKPRVKKNLENVQNAKPHEEVVSEHSNTSKTNFQTDDTDVYRDAQTTDEKAFLSLTKSVESSLQAVESLLQNREMKQKELKLYESLFHDFRAPKPCFAEIQEQALTGRCLISEIKKPVLYKTPLGEKVASKLRAASSFESVPSSSSIEAQPIEADSEVEIDFKEWEKTKSSEECQLLEVSTSQFLKNQSTEFLQLDNSVPSMPLVYFKNAAPLHLTELTEDGNAEQNMKVVIKNKIQVHQEMSEPLIGKPVTIAPKSKVPIKSPKQWQPSNSNTPRSKSQRISAPSRGSVAYSARPPVQKSNSYNTTRTQPISSTSSARQSITKPLSRHLSGRHNTSKTIETLKVEKVDIFEKMRNTQERIIELLDKLKMALLEVYIPSSTHEKNKRQKNAMEFSVRFSRNFLYPLKGMIEDIRICSPDVLNSSTSNDATMRVAAVYNLLHQSLSTYFKQLRFFLLDQVPQKLGAVLEMLNAVTKSCLHKGLFDRNDTIVECMLDRSNKFLEYLSEFHDKPEKHDSPVARVTNPSRVASKNYDLKMCMNDLNMYEPKLVAKRKSRKSSNKKVVEERPMETIVVTHAQMLSARKSNELLKLNLENVSTQMMRNENSEIKGSTASYESTSMLKDENATDCKTQMLAQKLAEALRSTTKNQVSHVLQPLLQSFGIGSEQQVGFAYP